MKTEDFERLKAICENEGFEISIDRPHCDTFNISVKNIWEGVEFFLDAEGVVRKITDKQTYEVLKIGVFPKCKPSTEQAYVEQLKKEAFERFGEIKEGDRFDRTPINDLWNEVSMEKDPFKRFDWKYDKSSDTLFLGRYGIYSKGKWATKLRERLTGSFGYYEIIPPSRTGETIGFAFHGFTDTEGILPIDKLNDAGKFLASQLEKYLNGEIE